MLKPTQHKTEYFQLRQFSGFCDVVVGFGACVYGKPYDFLPALVPWQQIGSLNLFCHGWSRTLRVLGLGLHHNDQEKTLSF